jgi:hypothetical protein
MAQPNAQNSELDPKKHPSGDRIEKIVSGENAADMNGDKGLYGETLRPSEREDSYVPTDEKSEGARDTHRRTPSTRQQ